MYKQPARRSSLFLMELIIAIFFFTLASTICIRFFIKSHFLEEDSKNLNHAITSASSVAEIFRNQSNVYDSLNEIYPDGTSSENNYKIFYDENWELCSSSDGVYTVSLLTRSSDSFLYGNINVLEETTTLYQLHLKKYIGQEESFYGN